MAVSCLCGNWCIIFMAFNIEHIYSVSYFLHCFSLHTSPTFYVWFYFITSPLSCFIILFSYYLPFNTPPYTSGFTQFILFHHLSILLLSSYFILFGYFEFLFPHRRFMRVMMAFPHFLFLLSHYLWHGYSIGTEWSVSVSVSVCECVCVCVCVCLCVTSPCMISVIQIKSDWLTDYIHSSFHGVIVCVFVS